MSTNGESEIFDGVCVNATSQNKVHGAAAFLANAGNSVACSILLCRGSYSKRGLPAQQGVLRFQLTNSTETEPTQHKSSQRDRERRGGRERERKREGETVFQLLLLRIGLLKNNMMIVR